MTSTHILPRVLTAVDLGTLRRLVANDPVVNVVVDAQLSRARSLSTREVGGTVWGVEDPSQGALRAAVFSGGNLIPVGTDLDGLADIAHQLRQTRRCCSSVVGRSEAVATMWPVLSKAWGSPREIRHRQPLLAIDRPSSASPDPGVRPARVSQLGAYEHAAVQMFAEELGVLPSTVDGGSGYRRRLIELIRAGRALARFDSRGRIEFKAEIGALSQSVAQIQGVWVRPDLRGLGIGTSGMAAVIRLALEQAPMVCLYVNDYNTVARRVYERVGFRQVETFTTILF